MPNFFEIPLSPDPQRFTITLGGVDYNALAALEGLAATVKTTCAASIAEALGTLVVGTGFSK